LGALRDRHLGLRDGAGSIEVDGDAAEEMQDADALGPGLLADLDELITGALRPGRHHAPVGMPDGAEALPIAGIAPDSPVLHQLADLPDVFDFGGCSGHGA